LGHGDSGIFFWATQMLFLWFSILTLSFWIGASCPSAAQEESGTAVQDEPILGEVMVEAERETLEEEPMDTSAFVTVIRPDRQRYRVTSVPELLKQSAGVDIRQLGGLGNFATVSIRGSTAEQVVIFLDGVELNRARSGVVDISQIPLDVVERIEVYRGTSPAKFSNAGIGGVINIITKKGKRRALNNVNVAAGSFGTLDFNATRSQSFDRFDYLAFVNYGRSDGDFKFADDNGTPFFSGDDETVRRKNNDYDQASAVFNAGVRLGDRTRLEISENAYWRNQGIPGIGAFQSETANLITFRNLLSMQLKRQGLALETLDADVGLSFSLQEQRFEDKKGEIGVGNQDNRDRTVALAGNILLRLIPTEWTVLYLNTGGGWERFRSRNLLADDPEGEPQQRYRLFGAFEQEFYTLSDSIVLSPSLRYDFYRDEFGGMSEMAFMREVPSQSKTHHFFSPKIGLRYEPMRYISLKANAGRYARAPNFSELFGDRGGIVGNTELDPEKGINWDAGIGLMGPELRFITKPRLEFSFFYSRVDDLILFIQNTQRTSVAQNISKARIRGYELTWGAELFDMVHVDGAYTFEDARDRSDISFLKGNMLPGRPRHKIFSREELVWRRWILFHEYHHMADNFLDRANTVKISSRDIHNAGVSFSPVKGLTLTAEVMNLTDEDIFDFIGFPLPGRSYFFKLDWSF